MNGVMSKIKRNPNTMSNNLPSSESMKRYDKCRGIHGAARERRGVKKATNAARRRFDKEVIKNQQED